MACLTGREDELMIDEAPKVKQREQARPSPIDVHVGTRVRRRRTLLGMSQEKLGEALGLTFQQVQKYERGINRIGASRLFDLGRVLDVPIGFFFDDMPDTMSGLTEAVTSRKASFAANHQGFEDETVNKRETLELVRAYYRITDPEVRKQLFNLLRSLGPAD